MRKITNKKCNRGVNTKKGKVKARCSTKKNATKQMRLLRSSKFRKTFRKRKGGAGDDDTSDCENYFIGNNIGKELSVEEEDECKRKIVKKKCMGDENCLNEEWNKIINYRLEKQRKERDEDAKSKGFELLLLGEDLNQKIIGMELYLYDDTKKITEVKEYRGVVESYGYHTAVHRTDRVAGDYDEITSYKITFKSGEEMIVTPKQKLYFKSRKTIIPRDNYGRYSEE